jgi:hypothetical protein
MNNTRKENLCEVTKSGNLIVRSYFPLFLSFFNRFFFKFGNTRFWGNYVERNSMFCFVVRSEVLCKEVSCDLSDLVEADVSEYPINPLGCVEFGLVS